MKVVFYKNGELCNETQKILLDGGSIEGWLYPKGASLKGQAPTSYNIDSLRQAVNSYKDTNIDTLYFNTAEQSLAVMEF